MNGQPPPVPPDWLPCHRCSITEMTVAPQEFTVLTGSALGLFHDGGSQCTSPRF